MNQKAQFDVARKTIFWMIAGVLIAVIVLVFAMVIGSYRSNLTETPIKLKANLVALRFVNIPECFAFTENSSGIVHPGTIDISKFNTETLNQCYLTESKKGIKELNFRIKLERSGEEITTNNYFNQDDFTIFKEVLVKREYSLTKDRLIIYVQNKIGN